MMSRHISNRNCDQQPPHEGALPDDAMAVQYSYSYLDCRTYRTVTMASSLTYKYGTSTSTESINLF